MWEAWKDCIEGAELREKGLRENFVYPEERCEALDRGESQQSELEGKGQFSMKEKGRG